MSPGRLLIAFGAAVIVVGAVMEFAPGIRLGRLPGDVSFGSGSVRFFIPLGTALLVSILLTIILTLMNRR